MSHISRSISASSEECRLAEPARLSEGLGNVSGPGRSIWETRSFITAMFLIFAVAIILAIAISSSPGARNRKLHTSRYAVARNVYFKKLTDLTHSRTQHAL